MLNRIWQFFLAERLRWFLWTPALFALGIGLYFSLPTEPPSWPIVILIEVLIVALYLFKKNSAVFFTLTALLIAVLGFADVMVQTQYLRKQVEPVQTQETTYLQGKIFKTDLSRKGKTRLWLQDVADFENARKGIYKITLSSAKDFQIGKCIELAVTLKPYKATGYYQFERDAFYDGISGIGYAISDAFEKDCEKPLTFKERLLNSINGYRKKMTDEIYRTLPKNEASIASAVITGNKSLISTTQYNTYRTSGLAHFLAISGLHMGFMATLCFVVIRTFLSLFAFISLRFSTKKLAAFFAILSILIYLVISGFSISAQRAFIMTTLVFVGFFVSRQAISMRTVATAALLILIFEPYVLVRPSFQMSFAAATALVAFYEHFQSHHLWTENKNILSHTLAYFIGIALTTIIATLATLPFASYHFSNIAVYTLLTNILAAPIIGFIIMPFVFVCLLALPLHIASLPLKIVGFGISLLNNICAKISVLPHADFSALQFSFLSIILISIGGLWLVIWQQKWRYLGLIGIFAGFLSSCVTIKPSVFYTSEGRQIGIRDGKNELIILAKKENRFISQLWLEQNHFVRSVNTVQGLNITCKENICTYKNILEFDLNGHLKLKEKDLIANPKSLGGFIYFSPNDVSIQTVRDIVGFRPWNNF